MGREVGLGGRDEGGKSSDSTLWYHDTFLYQTFIVEGSCGCWTLSVLCSSAELLVSLLSLLVFHGPSESCCSVSVLHLLHQKLRA